MRLLLLQEAGDRVPAHRLPAAVDVLDHGRWCLSFDGYEPGVWTIWAEVSGAFAPLVLPDVRLDEMDPDLGTVRLTRGSGFRLKLRMRGEMGPGFAVLEVKALEGPEFGRMDIRIRGEVAVSGLGPGRYRVTGGWMRAEDEERPTDFDEEIEIDGRSDYEREVTVGADR